MQEQTILNQSYKKNFNLSATEFSDLVTKLRAGDDTLFEKIYLAHFEHSVNYLVRHQGADYEDAYTSTMNALLEIRKDLIHGKIEYGNLAYFFTYRAGKKLSKIRKRGNSNLKIVGIDNMDFKDEENLMSRFQTKEMKEIISKTFQKLGEECSQLLKHYYYDDLSWSKIAKMYYPEADAKTITTKGDTFKKRAKRRCLPAFKTILERFIN